MKIKLTIIEIENSSLFLNQYNIIILTNFYNNFGYT